jgi:kumamolisin
MLSAILAAATLLIPNAIIGQRLPQKVPALGAAVLGDVVPDSTPAQLSIALNVQNMAALDQLLADLQNRDSPSYHQWLNPDDIGARFGVPASQYARIGSWLAGNGFSLETFPTRTFIQATGTVAQVRHALGIQPHWITVNGQQYRTYTGAITVPEDIAPYIQTIAGLDTRVRFKHHLTTSDGDEFGAADLRMLYDMAPLISAGGGKGISTAVIGTQEQDGPPATGDISYYYDNVSMATATYNPITLPNANGDYDSQGANEEYELDVEMHSVGVPNATTINLILSPASTVFVTGSNYAINTLSTVNVVSLSLGICEPDSDSSDVSTMESNVKLGLAEGQTWFAASGDDGADDCDTGGGGGGGGRGGGGGGGGGATVDFPADLPEIMAMGGTQMLATNGPTWDSSGNLDDYQTEAAWNQGANGGAGGGGVSTLFTTLPTWQTGVSTVQSGGRNMPDLALMAAPSPGVAVDVTGTSGDLIPIGGTSVASPLAAGIFALIGSQLGCKLGDVHATVYKLGLAQAANGAAPFHDITSGNNTFDGITGFTAGPGYDAVTGWGSIDAAVLLANFPSCNGTAPSSSSSSSSGGASSTSSAPSNSSSSSSGSGASSSSSSGSVGLGSSSGGFGSGSSSSGSSASSPASNNGGNSGGVGSSSAAGNGGGSGNGGNQTSGPLESNAKPTPIGDGSAGCGTGPGSSGLLVFGFVLSFLASRRRRNFFFS